MKCIFQLKTMLLTFLLGLTAVFVFNGSMNCSKQNSVETHGTQADSTVVVPVRSENIPPQNTGGGGASGGVTCDEARAEAKRKKRKFSHPNCD